MLSYRHGYHAGNHADVLKHIVLCLIIRNLLQKDKPFTIIDTHAGAGLYNLDSSFAQKRHEYESGYSKIIEHSALRELVPEYFTILDGLKQNNKILYPGSPYIEASLARSSETIFLSDLHKSEFENLRELFKRDRRIHIELRDGLASLKALLPPLKKRGLILIDPSYEIKSDYTQVVKALKEGHSRFNQGIFAIWYPVLSRLNDHSKRLVQDIKRLNLPLLQVELRVSKQEEELGMCGSGMLIVNYPYKIDEWLEPIVGELYHSLCDQEEGGAKLVILNEQA